MTQSPRPSYHRPLQTGNSLYYRRHGHRDWIQPHSFRVPTGPLVAPHRHTTGADPLSGKQRPPSLAWLAEPFGPASGTSQSTFPLASCPSSRSNSVLERHTLTRFTNVSLSSTKHLQPIQSRLGPILSAATQAPTSPLEGTSILNAIVPNDDPLAQDMLQIIFWSDRFTYPHSAI